MYVKTTTKTNLNKVGENPCTNYETDCISNKK